MFAERWRTKFRINYMSHSEFAKNRIGATVLVTGGLQYNFGLTKCHLCLGSINN
jgi:hypothetical protein